MHKIPEEVKAPLRKALKRVTNLNFWAGAGSAIFFGLMLLIPILNPDGSIEPHQQKVFLGVFGFFFLMGIGVALHTKKTATDLDKILDNHPEKIVWIYKTISTANMRGATVPVARFVHLTIGLINKKRLKLMFKKEDEADAILKKLIPLLPHATFGFKPEFNKKFRKDPNSLRK